MSRSDEAINYYHDLLAGRHLESTRQVLAEATARASLSFGGRAICSVLRPYFITAEQYEYIRRASTLVMISIAALGRRLLSDSRLRSELDLDALEEEIIRVETGYGSADVSARLDGFLSEEGDFNFVEYNAESPGGLGYGNALSDAFARMPIMLEFSKRYDARALPVRTFVFDALVAAYHRWGGKGLPNIAIIDWRGVGTYSEFLLMKAEFESHGCRVKIADPAELEYRDGRLFIEDFAIDLVYKRVVTAELLAKHGTRHAPLMRCATARSAWRTALRSRCFTKRRSLPCSATRPSLILSARRWLHCSPATSPGPARCARRRPIIKVRALT